MGFDVVTGLIVLLLMFASFMLGVIVTKALR